MTENERVEQRRRGLDATRAGRAARGAGMVAVMEGAGAFTAWRDAVWTFVIERLAQVEAGEVSPPESPDALIALLPDIDWP